MENRRFISRVVFVFAALAFSLFVLQCGGTKTAKNLPHDILGINVGMNKAEVQKRLEEIAVFDKDERKNQQVWKMKDASRFSHIAVGYDKENEIRYITAFVDKESVKEKIRFTEVGDISTAKQEILEPHYRYIWQVPADGGKPAYEVNIYGDNPEFVTNYTLSKIYKPDELKEESEEESE